MYIVPFFGGQIQARAARAELDHALDMAGWPWLRRLSRWIDCLVMIEEGRS